VTTGEAMRLLGQGMFVGVALAAPIGPINVEIVRRCLRGGFRSGWLVGAGAVSADTLYAVLVVSGLTPLADRPALRLPLYLAGAAMLAYVGWSSLRAAFAGNEPVIVTPSRRRSYATGFLMAALNPMGIVYWLSIGAALVATAVDQVGAAGSPLLVGGVFFGILCWVTLLCGLGLVARPFVTGVGMRWVTGLSGALIVGFAVWFVVQAARTL
jgi:L-lysine exporter family protein LysE/ArgO